MLGLGEKEGFGGLAIIPRKCTAEFIPRMSSVLPCCMIRYVKATLDV